MGQQVGAVQVVYASCLSPSDSSFKQCSGAGRLAGEQQFTVRPSGGGG
jgi:hypothetical protein